MCWWCASLVFNWSILPLTLLTTNYSCYSQINSNNCWLCTASYLFIAAYMLSHPCGAFSSAMNGTHNSNIMKSSPAFLSSLPCCSTQPNPIYFVLYICLASSESISSRCKIINTKFWRNLPDFLHSLTLCELQRIVYWSISWGTIAKMLFLK